MMNKSIKFTFLIVMLAIPAAIFIFLKSFGDNRFDVEIFYQNGTADITECLPVEGQFYVSDSLLEVNNKVHIVLFSESDIVIEVNNIKSRLLDTFSDEIAIVIYATNQADSQMRSSNDLALVVSCGFLSKDFEDLVLVDGQRRIRGFYKRDLDEIDRLIVETKIVVENEQRDPN